MNTENHTYKICSNCGQYINTVTTDHVIAHEFGDQEVYLHIRPCFQQYNDIHDTHHERVIRKHQHLS